MRKISLLSCTMLLSLFFVQEGKGQCTDTTIDCQALGYTKSSCETGGVRCPTENLWYCPVSSASQCQIGDILNSDMSCTTNKESGKTPIGVVVYLNDSGGGQAIALEELGDMPIKTDGLWDDKLNLQIANVVNEKTDFESCSKTKAYLDAGDSSEYPAAWAVNNYAPTSAPFTKGKWCIPAYGILYYAKLAYFDVINNKLNELGAQSYDLSQKSYWSSTVTYKIESGLFKNATSGYDEWVKDSYPVRPVIEF